MRKLIKMEKKLSDNTDALLERRKARRKVVFRSVLLVAFLLIINTFAWFTYISKAGVTLSGSVVNWDVTFLEETNVIKEIDIDITDMKPGMVPFEKEIVINNGGDIDAKLNYRVESLTLLGQELLQDKQDETIGSIKNDYPFKLELSSSSDIIPVKGSANVKIGLNWDYEADEYYKLNNLYTYDPGVYYYTLVGSIYQVDNTVTEENFATKIANGLYLEKDDADSYWGYSCGKYENDTGKSCLHMRLILNVTQAN